MTDRDTIHKAFDMLRAELTSAAAIELLDSLEQLTLNAVTAARNIAATVEEFNVREEP